jgi:hypothetical protein
VSWEELLDPADTSESVSLIESSSGAVEDALPLFCWVTFKEAFPSNAVLLCNDKTRQPDC